MWRLGMVGKVGAVMVSGLLLAGTTAHAQYGGYPAGGYGTQRYRPVTRGISFQIGVGASPVAPIVSGYPNYQSGYQGYQGASAYQGSLGYQGYQGYQGGYAGGAGVCATAGPVGAGQGYGGYPSPAARQGYSEGQLYYETGIAPSRPLSPAEAQGFQAGERRAAATPWQLDPVRQQGYREGQLYWETGIAPNRPLSPAEAQGFQAGERRAATGSYNPYR